MASPTLAFDRQYYFDGFMALAAHRQRNADSLSGEGRDKLLDAIKYISHAYNSIVLKGTAFAPKPLPSIVEVECDYCAGLGVICRSGSTPDIACCEECRGTGRVRL